MKSAEIKIFVAILIVALVLVGFALAPMILTRKVDDHPIDVGYSREMLVPPGSHVRGNPNAPTTIVVFSDFQCPSCRDGVSLMKLVEKKMPGQTREVFHHVQIRPDHVYSRILSRAAEAAGEQGDEAFWKMHDLLFEKQKDIVSLSSEQLVLEQIRKYAKELKLDMLRFNSSMARKAGDPQFDKDNKLGEQVHIVGTPTYFVISSAGSTQYMSSNAVLEKWAIGKDDPPAKP